MKGSLLWILYTTMGVGNYYGPKCFVLYLVCGLVPGIGLNKIVGYCYSTMSLALTVYSPNSTITTILRNDGAVSENRNIAV